MILLGFGSNLGDREGNIRSALDQLAATPGVTILNISSLYETEPVGYTDQPLFLNAAASIATTLSPLELLDVCLSVESKLGRVRELRWGPRTIDIDILLFNDIICSTDRLKVPHPEMHKRSFVLAPLAEIVPDCVIYDGKTAEQVLSECGKAGVRLLKKLDWNGGR